MRQWKCTVFVMIVACVVNFYFFTWQRKQFEFGGTTVENYQHVFDIFRENFANGLETDGAAFALYRNGEMVVNIWGGYSDFRNLKKWTADTMGIWFSTTKAVVALCMALLVDRKLMDYNDFVATHWPEFGTNGKSNITIQMILGHKAGLAALDEEVTLEKATDWKALSVIFERQKLNWLPGQRRVYHAFTFGWLMDQIVRRVDPKHRSIGAFFAEEIARPNGIDFYIGLPPAMASRVAVIVIPSPFEILRKIFEYDFWRVAYHALNRFSLIHRVFNNPWWLAAPLPSSLRMVNSCVFYTLEMPAVNGIGTAQALAKLFSLLMSGRIINKAQLNRIAQPVDVNVYDEAFGFKVITGWGFLYTINPMGQLLLNHAGFGGQDLKIDVYNNLSFAYLTNKMKLDIAERSPVFQRLQTAVYECFKKEKKMIR